MDESEQGDAGYAAYEPGAEADPDSGKVVERERAGTGDAAREGGGARGSPIASASSAVKSVDVACVPQPGHRPSAAGPCTQPAMCAVQKRRAQQGVRRGGVAGSKLRVEVRRVATDNMHHDQGMDAPNTAFRVALRR